MAPLLLVILVEIEKKAQLRVQTIATRKYWIFCFFVPGAEASEDGKGNTEGRTEMEKNRRRNTMPSQRD